MSEAPLSDNELRNLRALLRGLSAAEWRVLKTLAIALVGHSAGAEGQTSGPAVADDAELDGAYGDPVVKKDPKRWAGAHYVTAHYSACPTDYLLCLAESLEYFANKDRQKPDAKKHRNGTPFWAYNLKDAARARGWAARNRGKVFAPPSHPDPVDADYSDAAEPPMDDAGEEQWSP